MKIQITEHLMNATRTRIRFAWFPTKVSEGHLEWIVWLEKYEVDEIYYSTGVSFTGYDYTPKGWHAQARRPLHSQNTEGLASTAGSENPKL